MADKTEKAKDKEPEETTEAATAEPLALISRVDGESRHSEWDLGVLQAGHEVKTFADGRPLTDTQKRKLAQMSEYLYIRGEADA